MLRRGSLLSLPLSLSFSLARMCTQLTFVVGDASETDLRLFSRGSDEDDENGARAPLL